MSDHRPRDMRNAITTIALLLTTLTLGACDPDATDPDTDDTELRAVINRCWEHAYQHQPCDPNGDDCSYGHCVGYAGPTFRWVCEMEEPPMPAGYPCDRHEECDAGVCLLATIHPDPDPNADYGACGMLCETLNDCPTGTYCHPVGDGQRSICIGW